MSYVDYKSPFSKETYQQPWLIQVHSLGCHKKRGPLLVVVGGLRG